MYIRLTRKNIDPKPVLVPVGSFIAYQYEDETVLQITGDTSFHGSITVNETLEEIYDLIASERIKVACDFREVFENIRIATTCLNVN